MDCNNCTKLHQTKVDPIPYIAHESDKARDERKFNRLVSLLIVVVILWFATIGMFVLYINQYDFSSIEYVQDGMGLNIIGDRNNVTETDD